jgi:hypothetical protein
LTLITMKQADFDSMSDEQLGWACAEPMLISIRGKDAETKTKVIGSLNPSQQALCMFRVFYDHARGSTGELYAWVSYLLQAPGYWQGVTNSLSYFGIQQMEELLEDTKRVIEEQEQRSSERTEFHPFRSLESNGELSKQVASLYTRFQALERDSLHQISAFIRANPQHFVRIEEY